MSIYFNSNSQSVTNDLDIDDSLETSSQITLSRVQKRLAIGSGLIIESVDGDCINISI